jgi:hypothetical protein
MQGLEEKSFAPVGDRTKNCVQSENVEELQQYAFVNTKMLSVPFTVLFTKKA